MVSVAVLLALLVLLELVVPSTSLEADTLLEELASEDDESAGGGPGGGLSWPLRAAMSSCRKASSLESTFEAERLLLEEVVLAEVEALVVVALLAVASSATPSEARISLSAPISPPPLSPRGGGGGGTSMRCVALVEKPLVPLSADRSDRLKLLEPTLLMAMTLPFYCARRPLRRSLVSVNSIGHQDLLS